MNNMMVYDVRLVQYNKFVRSDRNQNSSEMLNRYISIFFFDHKENTVWPRTPRPPKCDWSDI